MILQVLCVRDRGADVFGQPTFHLSVGAASRAFADEINRQDDNNVMFKHPEDFDLYVLGIYDDGTGSFETGVPRQVVVGKDVVIKRK